MSVIIRPLEERDLDDADRINRVAFGTFFGLPDPLAFRGDGDAVRGRWRTDPEASFAAELDGRVVASGQCMNWGSVGILGPLTVDVDHWSQGIAREMMPALIDLLDRRGHAIVGLFTHPQSPKHIRLYELFDFWMQRPTAVMDKKVLSTDMPDGAVVYSALSDDERAAAHDACRAVTETVYRGFDVTGEIRATAAFGFGDTVMIHRDGAAVGFAVCHHGAMSEAGSNQLLVKVGAVRSGPDAAADFKTLLCAAEALAAARGAPKIVAGTNVGRAGAYRALLDAGYRTFMNGIAMLRPDDPGYNVPEAFVIDDWR